MNFVVAGNASELGGCRYGTNELHLRFRESERGERLSEKDPEMEERKINLFFIKRELCRY
jgi:hypothetical protein